MKNKIFIIIIAISLFLLSSCGGGKSKIVGIWKAELYGSEQVIEFTDDGKFIDHTSFAENRYRVEGKNIVTYIDGDESTEVKIPFSVKSNVLKFGEIEYQKVSDVKAEDGAK